MDGTHQGGGFDNVLEGFKHFPAHIIAALKNSSSFLSLIVKSKPAQEIAAYEKTHGKEQLDAIKKAGVDAYNAERAKGTDKAMALVAGIRAAFECGVAEVKSLSTLAMTFLLSEAAADLGL